MIIETSSNRFFDVVEINDNPALSHCWSGVEMTRDRAGKWEVKNVRRRPELVRKAATRIVEQ